MNTTDCFDKDIALEIINTMYVGSLKKIDECKEMKELEELNKQANIYASELKAITGTDDAFRASVIDKAFRYYAPIIRKRNGIQ